MSAGPAKNFSRPKILPWGSEKFFFELAIAVEQCLHCTEAHPHEPETLLTNILSEVRSATCADGSNSSTPIGCLKIGDCRRKSGRGAFGQPRPDSLLATAEERSLASHTGAVHVHHRRS
jgi:hypothetical protein